MPRVSRLRNLSAEEKNTIALGKRLAELRKKRGHTQIELAQKMNLIQSVISAYERGRIRMTSEVLIQFCSALNVTPSVLLGIESENESELSLKIVKRMLKIQQLPLSKQKRLFATIDDTLKANDLLP
ncbi:hypothetical protein S1OALGB6SA_1993 [Olavius algarvensis spirochete endosymbiont]|nr:hypothetical protein S1OALGB6SA_1993 [Olavius algarvensis spirochete endosymbiont]